MARAHAPSEARSLVADLKKGSKAKELAARARQIPDPYHAAWALFRLGGDEPVLLDEALEFFDQVEQSWRRAELAGDAAPHVRDPGVVVELARRVVLLPADQARSQALKKVVKHVPREALPELLAAVLQDPETAVEEGKTVLREWARDPVGEVEEILMQARPATRARLYGYLYVQEEKTGKGSVADAFVKALAAARDVGEPVSVLRYLAGVARDEGELDAVIQATREDDQPARARVLLAVVAQADRLGLQGAARKRLLEAQEAVRGVADEKTRRTLEGNLEKAAGRMSTEERPAREKKHKRTPTQVKIPPTGPDRPVMALYNTYTGGLAKAHLNAVARAAPLCAAFSLDLMLIGFPAGRPMSIIEKAEADTRIGEGAGYARALLEAGRILWVPREHHAEPHRWPAKGPVVATTPEPDPSKKADLEKPDGPAPILVVGLGPRGLPRKILDAAGHHLELTGHGVSLETATAMGVLAERLRAWRREQPRGPAREAASGR